MIEETEEDGKVVWVVRQMHYVAAVHPCLLFGLWDVEQVPKHLRSLCEDACVYPEGDGLVRYHYDVAIRKPETFIFPQID